jgi:hypothetical protein
MLMNDRWWLFLTILGAIGIGWLVSETLFQYSHQDRVIKIKLFGVFPLRRIDLQQVEHISKIRLFDWSLYLWCERCGGYMLLFRGVAISLVGGETVLIAPRNREKLIATIGAEKIMVSDSAKSSSARFGDCH